MHKYFKWMVSGRGQRALVRRRLTLSGEPDLIYAVGDVHGCLDSLLRLEARIVEDAKGRPGTKLIVMLGDYIDRGPNSAGVIEHLLQGPPSGFHRVSLVGNHDQALLAILSKPSQLRAWLKIGGDQTLASYGLNIEYLQDHLLLNPSDAVHMIRSAVPAAHITALERIPICLQTPRYVFVHAGVRPGIDWVEQSDEDFLFIRREFLSAPDTSFDRTIVHGHTIVDEPVARPRRISVDTGAFLGRGLTAARLEGNSISFLSSES